jgi:hypothetical protein
MKSRAALGTHPLHPATALLVDPSSMTWDGAGKL